MIKLTQTVQKGGCAAKIPAMALREILSMVRFPPHDASILVDAAHFDDAGIQKVSDDLALVHTMDFFTPILDTPRLFGQVAAANALSDVYAMGGTPKTAMAILAFPTAQFAPQLIAEVLQGACDTLAKAGASLLGGHSIDDDTLKFGLAVTGFVDPQCCWKNSGAQVGDVLILTKALGTGTLTAGLKLGEFTEDDLGEAIASMSLLNRVPEVLGPELAGAVKAATDITGFGLLGHASHIARGSGKTLSIDFRALPILPLAWDALARGFLTKAHKSNRAYVADCLALSPEIAPGREQILFDPQTSGGLLLAVAKDRSEQVLSTLASVFPAAAIVGRVEVPQASALVIL